MYLFNSPRNSFSSVFDKITFNNNNKKKKCFPRNKELIKNNIFSATCPSISQDFSYYCICDSFT